MKIELTKEEQTFLSNMLLKEIADVQRVKNNFNVFDGSSPKAKYFKDSFWELDKFVNSIYQKLIK